MINDYNTLLKSINNFREFGVQKPHFIPRVTFNEETKEYECSGLIEIDDNKEEDNA